MPRERFLSIINEDEEQAAEQEEQDEQVVTEEGLEPLLEQAEQVEQAEMIMGIGGDGKYISTVNASNKTHGHGVYTF